MYKSRREGRAICTRITARMTVQILYTICISNKFLLIKEFFIIEIILNPQTDRQTDSQKEWINTKQTDRQKEWKSRQIERQTGWISRQTYRKGG